MTSAFENLCGPGKPLRAEPRNAKEFEGLHAMGLEKLADSRGKTLALASRFDLAYNAAHDRLVKDLIGACDKVVDKLSALDPPET